MTGNPLRYAHHRRFTSQTKAQIIALADHLTAQRTEEAARTKHLLLCRNAISDEELSFWKDLHAKHGIAGLRRDTRKRIERRTETIQAWRTT